MGQIKLIGSLMLLMIFSISIISFAVNFANDNNAAVDLSDDGEFTNLSSSLGANSDSFRQEIGNSSSAFYPSEMTTDSETIKTGGVFKTITIPLSIATNVFTATNSKLFGNDPAFGIILTTFASFLVLLTILFIWKTWKGGSPD